MTNCGMCFQPFEPADLDYLGRCEPCFRVYLNNLPPDRNATRVSTHNPHNSKETRAYVQRLERKRMTPEGGVEHNYQKRIYG